MKRRTKFPAPVLKSGNKNRKRKQVGFDVGLALSCRQGFETHQHTIKKRKKDDKFQLNRNHG